MKSLILLRHAKSDWNTDFQRDHERPINDRGVRASKTVGRFLARAGEVPALVVTSSAVRARTTVELAAQAGEWQTSIEVTGALYEASDEAVLEVIHGLSEDSEGVLLAGHEPTWSSMVQRLTGARAKVVTATMVRIDLGVSRWQDVSFGLGTLVWSVSPKLLQRAGLGD